MEEILHQAERLEKDYDWLGAAKSYEKALGLLSQDDFSKMEKSMSVWDMHSIVLRALQRKHTGGCTDEPLRNGQE